MDRAGEVTVNCAADWAWAIEMLGDLEGAILRESGLLRHRAVGPCMAVLLDLGPGDRSALLNFITVNDFAVDLRAPLRAAEVVEVDEKIWRFDVGAVRVEAERCNIKTKRGPLPADERFVVVPNAGRDVGIGTSQWDLDYLQHIEALAHLVVEEAARDGSLRFIRDEEVGQTDLQLAVNHLARNLRMAHWEGDGCFTEHGEPGD